MKKEPLYRKDNKRAIKYCGDKGGDFKHTRHTKVFKNSDSTHASMHGKTKRGYDYTPLFRFLLSKVGKDWDEVFSEAKSRLDKEEPIFYMVALYEENKQETINYGSNSKWSGLFVDESNILQKVNPNLTVSDLFPGCSCCTHTFNGKVIANEWNTWMK